MGNHDILKISVHDLMARIDFPQDAQAFFLSVLDRITADSSAAATLETILQRYEETENCDYGQMLAEITTLCQALSIHRFSGFMLLCLCLAPRLQQRYTERKLDMQIFYNSMRDLRYKLEECRLIHGIFGTFVPEWYQGFFDLTRFALGRLQFEVVALEAGCEVDGVHLPAGSKAINIHIPRTGGRLPHEQVQEAYALAAEFFRDAFADGPVVFTCSSWMLYPWIRTVLASTTNMAAFYDDFTIINSGDYSDYNEVWRLFDCAYTGDPQQLPQDSSLRRAFVARMKQGETLGWGRGVFLYPKA